MKGTIETVNELRGALTRKLLSRIAFACFGAALGIFLLQMIPWGRIVAEFGASRWSDAKLKPLVVEALRKGLTYESVTRECPQGCPRVAVASVVALKVVIQEGVGAVASDSPIGAPVVWCIDHPSPNVSYVNGNPQRVVIWKDESPIPINRLKYDRCRWIVAVVRGARPDGVLLEFKGLR